VIITITELGERKYTVDFWRGEKRRHRVLKPEMYRLIREKCECRWTMRDFGRGYCGRQQQWVKGE